MFTRWHMRAAVLALASALLPWQAFALLAAPGTQVCPLKRVATECKMACHRTQPVKAIPSVPSCHRVQDAGEAPTNVRACFVARRCPGPEGDRHWVPEPPYVFASVASVNAAPGRVRLAGSPLALPAPIELPPPSPPPRHLTALH